MSTSLLKKANEQAENFHVPLQDELQRLVTHGILHLIGHEHDNPEQQEKMEALTEKYLAFAEVEK